MTLKPEGRSESPSKEKIEKFKRNLEREKDVHHDLFRLDDELTRKDVGFNPDQPLWEKVPHRHYYHTVNSDGKAQAHSAPSAGHFHEVEVEENEQGEIVSVKCGPPKVMSRGKVFNYKNDNHTHEISYIASELVKKRVRNDSAVKIMTHSRSEETQASNNAKSIVKG